MPEPMALHETLSKTVIRGSESWQFFAFVFGAVLLLLYGLIDDLVGDARPIRLSAAWKAITKAVTFFVVGYVTLLSPGGRNFLVWILQAFTHESH